MSPPHTTASKAKPKAPPQHRTRKPNIHLLQAKLVSACASLVPAAVVTNSAIEYPHAARTAWILPGFHKQRYYVLDGDTFTLMQYGTAWEAILTASDNGFIKSRNENKNNTEKENSSDHDRSVQKKKRKRRRRKAMVAKKNAAIDAGNNVFIYVRDMEKIRRFQAAFDLGQRKMQEREEEGSLKANVSPGAVRNRQKQLLAEYKKEMGLEGFKDGSLLHLHVCKAVQRIKEGKE